MNVSNRAILKFYTNSDDIVRLSIPRACMDKTEASAIESMEGILATDAVITNAGIPRIIRGAELVQTIRTPLMQA